MAIQSLSAATAIAIAVVKAQGFESVTETDDDGAVTVRVKLKDGAVVGSVTIPVSVVGQDEASSVPYLESLARQACHAAARDPKVKDYVRKLQSGA